MFVLGTFSALISSFAGSALGSVFSKTVKTVFKVGTAVFLILTILNMMPIKQVIIGDTLFNFLTEGNFQKMMNLIYYFFPVDFALSCIASISLTSCAIIFYRVLNHVIDYISLVSSEKSKS